MNKGLEIIIGLILIIAAIFVAWYSSYWWGSFWDFRYAAWVFLKGAVFWIIVLVGLLFLLLGISDLKG